MGLDEEGSDDKVVIVMGILNIIDIFFSVVEDYKEII